MPTMLGAPTARSDGQRIGLRGGRQSSAMPGPAALGLAPLPPTPRGLVAGHAAFVAAALRAGAGAGMAGVLWGGACVTLRAGAGAGVAGVLWGARLCDSAGRRGCRHGRRAVGWGLCDSAGRHGRCGVTLRAGTGAGMAGVLWGARGVTLRAGTGPGMAGVLWGAASATAGILGGTGAGTRRPPPAATAPDALPSTSTPTSASGRPPGTRRKRDGLQSAGCAETSVLW